MPRYFGTSQLDSLLSREAYASDGSIYRIVPAKVICPACEDEAIAAVGEAFKKGISVTSRGGGTGLAGGALGRGYVIDCSRLTSIKNINVVDRTVVCQSGIIYRDLNLYLKQYGLFFSPDPSSGDSCQIGGMLANNSSGAHSVKYGLTSHYVEAITVVNKNCWPLHLTKIKISSPEFDSFLNRSPEYRLIFQLLQENRSMILERWPKLKKNSSGYNIYQVISDFDRDIFNLPALYVGSQGTLGLFLDMKLSLCRLPVGEPASYRLFFNSLEEAGAAVEPLLETKPAALEIVDGATLNLIGRDKYSVPSKTEAMLLLEYLDGVAEADRQLNFLSGRLSLSAPIEKAANDEERQSLWAARRAIVPTLYRHDSRRRPFAMIEDVSLPVPKLPEFIGWMRHRLERENLVFGMYGHIGDGNLHIRPLLDISNPEEFRLAQQLYEEVHDKIFALGGSSTAEHADGRLRAPVVRRLYGDEIYGIFTKIKKILDPENHFNPDVILSERKFSDDIDFKKLEITCAACGKCNGYCPAYDIFRREDMSARGWLRMLHQGETSFNEIEKFYQYCLNCKSCTTVCPAGVDIAGDILKFKAAHPHKIARHVISVFDNPGLFEVALKTGAVFDPLARTGIGRKLIAMAGKKSFGWDDKAVFLQPAFKTLRERYPQLIRATGDVALFHGCADNYFVSAAGDALIKVARHYGWDITLPPQKCCGLPMEVYGHRDNLIEKAKHNIDSLQNFQAVVFTCASCLHRIADYEELFEKGSEYHKKALALKARLFDICQYILIQNYELPHNGSNSDIAITYHHPCHLRAAKLENEPLKLLAEIEGINIIHPELSNRCCGQAGSFGYTHYREGMAIFSRKKEEYEKLKARIIVSSCPSCISKIRKEMGNDFRVCHPIEIVADLIEGKKLD